MNSLLDDSYAEKFANTFIDDFEVKMERRWEKHEKYDSLEFLLGHYLRHTIDVLTRDYLVSARDSWGVVDSRAKFLEGSRRQAFNWYLAIAGEWHPSHLNSDLGKIV